jgi:phosphatidylglycerophosphate synthase
MSRSQNDELSIGSEANGLRSDERVNGTKPASNLLATRTNGAMPHGLIVVGDSAAAQSRVCGLPLLARMICALDRATDTVYVLSTPTCPESALREVRRELDLRPRKPNVVWIASLAAAPTDRGLFVLPITGVLDDRVCKKVSKVEAYSDKILQFRRPGERPFMWYVGARHTFDLLGQLAGKADAGSLLPAVLERQARQDIDPGRELCDRVSDELSRRAAEEQLFAQARKASDTWIARNFDRHVSIWMTRWLVPLPVTPNQVTVIATLLGVIGAGFLAVGTYGSQLFGSILLVLSVVIDGCDGEVARLKYLESDFGRRLDFFLDNVVNTLGIFACSAGYYFQGGPVFYLYASYINAGAALASVLPVYWLFFRENKEAYSPEEPAAPKQGFDATGLAENIAGRDFVYLIFFLALFGRAHWFAYFCLVGLIAFLVFVIALNVRRWQASHR